MFLGIFAWANVYSCPLLHVVLMQLMFISAYNKDNWLETKTD